jgi:hypothetical protein
MEGLAGLLCCGVVPICLGVAVLKVERRIHLDGDCHWEQALTMDWPRNNIQKG